MQVWKHCPWSIGTSAAQRKLWFKPTEAQRKAEAHRGDSVELRNPAASLIVSSQQRCHCSPLSSLGAVYLRDAVSQIVPPRPNVPYLFRRAKPAAVGSAGDFIWFQLPPTPLTGDMRLATRAVQDASRRKACSQRYQVRPVRIRTRSRQVSSVAFWAFDAMTNARHDAKGPSV